MSCHCNKVVVLKRDEKGIATVWCDPCIASIVQALNDAGINTVASCCGHLTRPSSIILEDGREIFIMPFEEARRIDCLWPPINLDKASPWFGELKREAG